VTELSAVVLLLLGRTAAFGAILIIVVMLGGMTTHVIFDGGRHMTSEVVPLVLATIVLIVQRKQVSNLIATGERPSRFDSSAWTQRSTDWRRTVSGSAPDSRIRAWNRRTSKRALASRAIKRSSR
jgi:hypothetical protein